MATSKVVERFENVNLNDYSVDTYTLGVDSNNYVKFMFGDQSKKVAGLSKLVCIYLKKLFTGYGTNPLDLNEGTAFINLVGSNIGEEEEALLIVQDSIKDAEEQVIADQTNQDLPSDERLSSARLISFNFITQDRLELVIDLLSVAGSKVRVKVPKVELS